MHYGAFVDVAIPLIGAASLLLWAYFFLVQSGYPVIATACWAVPAAAIVLAAGLLIGQPWRAVADVAVFGIWMAMWFYEPFRRFWYKTHVPLAVAAILPT